MAPSLGKTASSQHRLDELGVGFVTTFFSSGCSCARRKPSAKAIVLKRGIKRGNTRAGAAVIASGESGNAKHYLRGVPDADAQV